MGESMRRDELALRMIHACTDVILAEDELAGLGERSGEAGFGEGMVALASAISQAVVASEGGVKELFDDVAMAVMPLGGSFVPLWHAWLDGLQEAAPAGDDAATEELKAMFAQATSDVAAAGGAGCALAGAFVAAGEAVAACDGDELDLLDDAADAAEATLGAAPAPDAGAMAAAHFLRGLSRA